MALRKFFQISSEIFRDIEKTTLDLLSVGEKKNHKYVCELA